ncbi:MAG TPA: hypothetical protein DDW49_01075, partial [Deltaproteobacteria bacterium]|nr:hypothetical protein [Deltaproteobacteria bacterium]
FPRQAPRGGHEIHPDTLAPGQDILTSDGPNDYREVAGTSFAQPFISGVIALMLQVNPNLTTVEVKKILVETSVPLIGYTEKDQGSGQIQPLLAVALASYLNNKAKGMALAKRLGIKQQVFDIASKWKE